MLGCLIRTDRAARSTVLAITLLACALRSLPLLSQSLWRDEVDALLFATRPLPQLLDMFRQPGQNGPLFFLLLRPWLALSGHSEFALRFPAMFFGVLSVPLLYVLLARLAGRPVALVGALLMATAPYGVWYGQEAKMYSLLTVLAPAALLAIVWLRERAPGAAWLPWAPCRLGVVSSHNPGRVQSPPRRADRPHRDAVAGAGAVGHAAAPARHRHACVPARPRPALPAVPALGAPDVDLELSDGTPVRAARRDPPDPRRRLQPWGAWHPAGVVTALHARAGRGRRLVAPGWSTCGCRGQRRGAIGSRTGVAVADGEPIWGAVAFGRAFVAVDAAAALADLRCVARNAHFHRSIRHLGHAGVPGACWPAASLRWPAFGVRWAS